MDSPTATANQGDTAMSTAIASPPPQTQTSCPACRQAREATASASHPPPSAPPTTPAHQHYGSPQPASAVATAPYVASTSYPQPQQQPYSYPFHSQQYEQQINNTNSTLAAAITLGSALGLTAAAAVRWLNGGDFQLFPPAVPPAPRPLPPSTMHQQQQLEQLVESVTLQTERQEVLVNKLQETLRTTEMQQQRHLNRSTDEAMARLKQQQKDESESPSLLVLKNVQSELQMIREALASDTDDAPLHARLEITIDRLDTILQKMEMPPTKITSPTADGPGVDSSDGPAIPSATVSVSTDTSGTNNKTTLGSTKALEAAIRRMVSENEVDALRTASQMLYLYVVNVSEHPRVPRYRKIFTSNESFQRNVAHLQGASDLLLAVGFVEQESSNNSKSACWEWLPPSIHNNQPKDDEAEESVELRSSPQKAWLGDSEATYLERLKEAAAALEVLKAAGTTEDTDKGELTDAALLAAGIRTSPDAEGSPNSQLPATTPPRPTSCTISSDESAGTNDMTPSTRGAAFQTPNTGTILSPPATKKQSRLLSPPGAFPSLEHPLVGVTEESTPSSNNDTNPARVSEDGEDTAAEDTMWK